MKCWLMLLVLTVFLAGTPAQAVEFDMLLDIFPASLFIDTASSPFSLNDGVNDVEMSSVYMMPNMQVGVSIEFLNFYMGIQGGAGVLLNDEFRSMMLNLKAGIYWEVLRSLAIGPHIGLVYFPNPDWIGSGNTNFDAAPGVIAGLQFAMGDEIMYLASIDLFMASFDADSPEAVSADSSLDMLGLGLQFGVRGRF